MNRSLRVAGLVAALLMVWATSLPPAAGAKRPKLYPYTVQPGDSCWSIAEEIFGDPRKYPLIYRYNDFAPRPPHLLEPGTTLMLPRRMSSDPAAHVRAVRKDVRARPPRAPEWRPAYEEMALWRLYRVATGEESSALIQFRDASDLRMREEALLLIHGGSARSARTRRVAKSSVVLERGTVRGGLAKLDAAARGVTVHTPSAEVRARSTEFQVGVERDETSLVCVYDGEADVSAAGGKVSVPADHGTTVPQGQPPQRPVKLLPPPSWEEGTADALVLVTADSPGEFSARWRTLRGARRYRVEVARDVRFRRTVVDAEVGGGLRELRARDLEPGDYWLRVAGIDVQRLEGRPARPVHVQVREVRGSRRLERGADGAFEAVGLVQLELAESPAASADAPIPQFSVNGASFSPFDGPVVLAEPGLHELRVRPTMDGTITTHPVRILRVDGRFTIAAARLHPGDTTSIELCVIDERDRPAALPGVAVTATPGGDVLLGPGVAGCYHGAIEAPATVGTLALNGRWALGPLTELHVPVQLTPEAEKRAKQRAAGFPWPDGPIALDWSRPAPGSGGETARPVSRLGGSLRFLEQNQRDGTHDLWARAGVSGELALFERRLGVAIELPWYAAPLESDGGHGSELGDPRLSARWLVLDRDDLALAAGVRTTLPVGGFPRDRNAALLEPGAMLSWKFADGFVFATDQRLGLELSDEGETGAVWAASWALQARIVGPLALVAEMDTAFGKLGERGDGVSALAAGGGLRLRLDRFQLTLHGGAALNDDGRSVYGRYGGGLTFDIGFPGPTTE